MSCYKFTELHYKDPIFKTVEATYIIHLEGNGRLPAIESQLQRFHPTETVYIAFNKGYKKCKKDEHINKPPRDLIDAFYTVFKDAEQKGYERVLVLEDDFIFDDEILDKQHPAEIERFLMEKQGQHFIYYLGTLPALQLSTFGLHNRVFLSGGTHSCIYTKAFIQNLLQNVPQNTVIDWDYYTTYKCTQYKYHKSLCYQIFPETENQKHWGDDNNFIYLCFQYIIIPFIKYIKIDKTPQPGYTIFEILSKCIVWFAIIAVIVMTIYLGLFVKNNYRWLSKQWIR